jgi:hypothetical protein
MPYSASHGAKRRRTFTFTVAGENHHDAASFLRGGNSGIHLFFNTLLALLVAFFRHAFS